MIGAFRATVTKCARSAVHDRSLDEPLLRIGDRGHVDEQPRFVGRLTVDGHLPGRTERRRLDPWWP